jgi:GTPase involved in cell partitioning and DNA repair
MRRGACNTSIANDDKNVAEQRTVVIDASTGQETISEPASDPKEEIIKLRKQLEEKDKQLEEKDKQIAILQASQNVQDIPQLVEDQIGLIKVQNLSRISEYDRKGLQALACKVGI